VTAFFVHKRPASDLRSARRFLIGKKQSVGEHLSRIVSGGSVFVTRCKNEFSATHASNSH
jgi:hypothetical protein